MVSMLLIALLFGGPVSVAVEHGQGADRVVLAGFTPQQIHALQAREPHSDQWAGFFQVFLGKEPPEDVKTRPPMLGSYSVVGSMLVFAPRFPFLRNRDHVARFDGPAFARLVGLPAAEQPDPVISVFRIEEQREPTKVTAIYPGGDTLPANLLRCYIHFSGPMGRINSYRHIKLLDEKGLEVKDPFLELTHELWDPSLQRLTLFFHPGRIKRGLVPNKEQGLALEVGKNYRLVVDAKIKDAAGEPIEAAYEKTFSVVAADRSSPDYRAWKINAPIDDRPLEVELDEPLDHALLHRMLRVKTAAGQVIAGTIEVAPGERLWRFRPDDAWLPGAYYIELDVNLEDRAGNRINRLFDMDAGATMPEKGTRYVALPFRVGTK